MTIRLIRLALSDSGATPAQGVELTDAEIVAKTEAGPTQAWAATGLTRIHSICHDWSGNLYGVDDQRHVVVKISEGGKVRWVAGSWTGVAGNNGTYTPVTASAARFTAPSGICCDKSGTIYVADTGNNQIRTIKDGMVSILAGSAAGAPAFVDGTGSAARFSGPVDVCVDKAGRVYVADSTNNAIRRIENNGKVVTLAGNGPGVGGDGLAEKGTATAITSVTTTWPSRRAMFKAPDDVSVDAQGVVYVMDAGNIKIKRITPDGEVNLHSGSGAAGASLGTSPNWAFTCTYRSLYDIDNDESGNTYVVDYAYPSARSRILKLDYNGRPFEVADFDSNSYNAGPWAIACSPGQKIFVIINY